MQNNQNLTKRERRLLKKQAEGTNQAKRIKNKKIRSLVIWVVVIIGLVGIIWAIAKFGAIPENEKNGVNPTVLTAVSKNDRVKGNPNSNVTLIEYSDFQCPACGAYEPLLRQLNEDFRNQIQFAYRHFPLRQIHANAQLAAQAAEAAAEQGKFWEMHDIIFDNQSNWSDVKSPKDEFKKYAEKIGLNIGQFMNDIDSKKIKNKIDDDYNGGVKAGVNSTPSLFLNGIKLNNPKTYKDLKAIIEETIKLNPLANPEKKDELNDDSQVDNI